MKVKGIISEERISLSELRDTLSRVEADRLATEKEMSYELRKSIEHANRLARTSPDKAEKLITSLLELEKVKPDIAFRIAQIMPRTKDELRAIYAKEKFTLSPEELDQILEMVLTHF
jgi:DNA-directed RNA polymerase subunit F